VDLEYEFDAVQQTPKLTKLNRLVFFVTSDAPKVLASCAQDHLADNRSRNLAANFGAGLPAAH